LEKYKKLVNNSIVFAIGNLGSKVINILMVPLYTFFLTTTEYGEVDLIMTTISLCLPIISLSVYDSVFRFIMDKGINKTDILSNALIISLMGLTSSILIFLLVRAQFFFNNTYLILMLLILSLQIFNEIFAQVLRATGRINLYVINSLILTVVIAVSNVVFLVFFDFGVLGYLYSLILANLLSFLYLIQAGKITNYIDTSMINKNTIGTLLRYSVPLIPNSIMWWLINSSTRYFLFYYVGSTANGLFAVASKIPSLLAIVTTIFFQAWQLSAVEEFDSKNKSLFYSQVFKYYAQVLFLFMSFILILLKPMMSILVEPSFFDSWKVVPLLLLAVIYSSFATFLGTNYVAAKKTTGVFFSSILSALVSLGCNFLFIPIFGLQGAGISSVISFFVMWIIRIFDTKKYIYMKIDIFNIIMNNCIIGVQTVLLFIYDGMMLLILEVLLFLILFFINRLLIKKVITLIKNILNRKDVL